MNLVQINERLKDLPPQVLKQYADGMNPEVPPYLALGELQRREIAEKKMAATQGGAQGPQPSIKEQLEQKAGLMALQQMQQQQAQQQQPRGPMPTPAGVPQPQAQPQPQAPFMAARGGLASVPVQFAFKPGGIVAFSNGGGARVHPQAQLIEFLKQMGLTPEEFARSPLKVQNEIREMMRAGAPAPAPATAAPAAQPAKGSALRSLNPAGVAGYGLGLYHGELGAGEDEELARRRQMPPTIDPNVTAETMKRVGPMTAPPLKDPRMAGTPSAAQQGAAPTPERAAPPAAQPAQTGLPAAASRSPYFAQADAALNEPNVKPTPEGIIAEQKALSPEAMQEDFMKQRMAEQRERAAGERAAFEKTRPSGLDDLIRVFGQAGQYKGLSGTGPAYTANQQQKRAEELAMERRQNELMTAVDTREYEGGKELFGARTKAMDVANKSFQDRLKSRAETLAQLAGVDERRIQSELDRLSQMEIQKLRMAEASKGTPDQQLFAQFLKLKSEGRTKEAQVLLDSLDEFKGAGKNQTDQILKMKLEPIYKARVEAAGLPGGLGAAKLAELDKMEKEIIRSMGGQSPQAGKVMSRADVATTAKSSGKTEQQVIDAAKAQGYTIQ